MGKRALLISIGLFGFAGCFELGMIEAGHQDKLARDRRAETVKRKRLAQVARLKQFNKGCPALKRVPDASSERYRFNGCQRTYVYDCGGYGTGSYVSTAEGFVRAAEAGFLDCTLVEAYEVE